MQWLPIIIAAIQAVLENCPVEEVKSSILSNQESVEGGQASRSLGVVPKVKFFLYMKRSGFDRATIKEALGGAEDLKVSLTDEEISDIVDVAAEGGEDTDLIFPV